MNTKKIFAIITLLCLIFTMTAAANFSDVKYGDNYHEAISVLSAIGIMEGYPDNTFKPGEAVTRAEFCAIITRFIGVDGDTLSNMPTEFSDVPEGHWASKYVAVATFAGLVNGHGNGIFKPDDDITYEQAVKVIITSLGYAPKADAMGGYPSGYLMVAGQERVSVSTPDNTAAITRGIAAQLLFKALSVPMMEQTSFGAPTGPEYSRDENVSVLYTKTGIIKAEIEIIAIDDDVVTIKYLGLDEVAAANDLLVSEDGQVTDRNDYLYYTLPTEISVDEIDLSELAKTAVLYISVFDETAPQPIIAVEPAE